MTPTLEETHRPVPATPGQVAGPPPNGIDLAMLHPRRGEKYSANLHRWLSADRGYRTYARIFIDDDGTLWIGFEDEGWFHGTSLMRVLCVGTPAERFAYRPGAIKGLREVVGFWEEYRRIGRCAIDRAHTTAFLNSGSRFEESGDTRNCTWCGCRQRRERWTEPVERDRWVTSSAAAVPTVRRF